MRLIEFVEALGEDGVSTPHYSTIWLIRLGISSITMLQIPSFSPRETPTKFSNGGLTIDTRMDPIS